MRLARRYVVAVVATVVMMAGVARAQVMDQIPANAMVVVRVKDLQGTSTKIAGFVKDIGVQDQAPMMADPLGFLQEQGKMKQGLNKGGDMAFVFLDPDSNGGPNKSMMFLIPVSDYQAFLGNFADAKTDGAVSTVTMPQDSEPSYVAKWGDYAAVSPNKDIVSGHPEGLKLAGLAAKELDAKDVVLVANLKVIREKTMPKLQDGRQKMIDQFDQGIQQNPAAAKYAPALKVALNQLFNVAQEFLNDADVATYSLNIGANGLTTTLMADFHPDSYIGKLVGQFKNTDQSFLAGLPDGKYLMMGGGVSDPKVNTQLVNDLIDPVTKELDNLGADAKPIDDYVAAIKQAVAAQTGTSFGMVAPQGELGASPLIQFVSTRTGDTKAMSDAMQKLNTAQQDAMKSFGVSTEQVKTTFTPAAKTVGGVQFDQYHTAFDMNAAQTPQQARAGQVLTFMYGSDGLNVYTGAVNDTTLLTVGGVSDELMAAAIASAKNNDEPLAKAAGIQAVAGELPKQRMAAFYFPLDVLVNTGFSYAAKFGMDMGVTMPATDPVGVTVATDGTSFRVDSFVPTKLVAGMADVAKKVTAAQHHTQTEVQPGGPGGL